MADYGIDINVNMGGSQGNFQTLIDSINQLNANFQKVGDSATTAGNRSKQSFADSMNIINKYGGSVQAAAANIDKWKAKIEELNRLNNTGSINQTKYNSQINAAAAAIKRIETATRQYNSVLGQTASTAKSAQSSFAGLTKTLNTLAGVMGTSVSLFGAFMVLKDVIKTISGFELAQKKLRSVLGETAEGMKELSQSAIDVGRTSIFGAKGVSELQIELAKMGFAKSDIMDMQRAIVNLATATQEDLASSAEIVANVIRAYKLEAKDATLVTNIMGKAFNDSALDLANFREAIKYVAPIAKQAGFTFKETTALLETLSNAGIKGSLAGTSLTNIMSRLGNETSSFSKAIGRTVNGSDEFIEALIELKKGGADLADVFELVDRRAAATFTILLQGVDTVEDFNRKLTDVNGVMDKQTAVQMESLTNKAKLLRSEFDGLVLSIDKGSGVLSYSLKKLLLGLSTTMETIGQGIYNSTRKSLNDILKESNGVAVSISDDFIKNADKIEKANRLNNLAFITGIKQYAEESRRLYKEVADDIEAQSIRIENSLRGRAERLFEQSFGGISPEFYGERIAAMNIYISKLDKESLLYKLMSEEVKILTQRYEEYLSTLDLKKREDEEAGKKRLKALENMFNSEINILNLQKKLDDEKIKMAKDSYEELADLETNNYAYNVMVAKKTLDKQIALGEDRAQAIKEYNLKMETYAIEFSNNMQAIQDKMNKEILQNEEKSLKEREKLLKENFKLRQKYSSGDIINETDVNEIMDKFGKDNPILNLLFGGKLRSDFLSGAISEEGIDEFAEIFNDLAGQVGDNLEGIVNSWVDATDKIVDQLNRQVDETQSAIAVEAELMAAGYANNLTAERNKLERLKEMRKEALEDQKQAQRAQLAMDSAQQVSGLITSAVKVFQAESGKGVLGIALAIAGIATIFGMMAKYRAMAKQQSIERFAEGGWIGGKSHRDGGTHIEAEKGEFVINKHSAFKHKELIEAINGDNKYELNKIYLNNLKNQVLTASVSLDDSKYLKGIYEKMNEKGRTVEYANGYRIEKNGIIITKVRLN